jgi:rubrerythrin
MQKEQAALKLYQDLAAFVQDSSLRSLLLALAEEEAKHKQRIAQEYEKQCPPDQEKGDHP